MLREEGMKGREGGMKEGLMLRISHKRRHRIITFLSSPLYRGSFSTNIRNTIRIVAKGLLIPEVD